MQNFNKLTGYFFAVALLGGAGYLLYTQAAPFLVPPCETPIAYSIGTYDERFGISRAALRADLAKAAAVWNKAAGVTLIEEAEDGTGIPVNLIYGTHQKATELGATIDAEQAAYDAQKTKLLGLKDDFSALKARYEREAAAYERRSAAYDAEVKKWNAQGGAPPSEYERLASEGRALESDRKDLNQTADRINDLADSINDAVADLNRLARAINAKVNTYNKNAGEDFDQGSYTEDASGKRIDIFEARDNADLTRVLAHELGHALGMEHVENPDSILYSFNIGDDLIPTAEDIAELKRVCKFE